MRTTLWRYHLGGGCALALGYVYLRFPPLRIAALVALSLATIAATLTCVAYLIGIAGHGLLIRTRRPSRG